ncbi:MAG: DUF6030 family protein [Hansschlegelia sp.]
MAASRLATILIVAALAAVALASVGLWQAPRIAGLFAPPQQLASPATPAPAPEPKAQDPLGDIEPEAAARLTAPVPDMPASFLWVPNVKADKFCAALKAIGLPNPVFQAPVYPAKNWSCVPDLVKPVGGDETEVSSLFLSARGASPDRLSGLRLKLNLLDRSTAPVVKSIAKDLMRRIFVALGWRAPEEVLALIEAERDGKVTVRGAVFDMRKEFGPEPRFNLIVTFPEALAPGGEDRFIAVRR